MTDPLSDKLATCVRTLLPRVDRHVERTVPLGEARVWALYEDGELVAWLKRHRNKDKARRELRAYREWLPHIGWGTPALIGPCAHAPSAMITAHVDGQRGDVADLTPAQEHGMFHDIGRFLAALHAVPIEDTDEVPLADALGDRCDAWAARAEGTVDDDLIDGVREMFAAPFPTSLKRVPAHRDLQLHNVIVRTDGDDTRVTVIDFGQARLDCWLMDLVKLFQLPEETAPGSFRALLQGYGRRLTRDEGDVLVRLRGLHGLASWTWSVDHGDRAGARRARRIVEGALDAWTPGSDTGHGAGGDGRES